MRSSLAPFALLLSLLAVWPAAADYRTAVEAYQAGRFEEACAEFDVLVQESPTYDFGHFVVGQCAAAERRYEEALLHLEAAVELNPGRADYACQLAGQYVRAKRYADALAVLDAVADGVDDHLRYSFHSGRGLAYAALERWDEALPELREADRARPEQWRVVDRIGLSLFGLKRYDEALPFLRRSVEMRPDNGSGQRLLAEALIRGGPEQDRAKSYAEALQAARAYRESSPDDLAAENLVGRAALGAGEYEEAVDSFTRYLSAAPGHCPARVNLALGQVGLRRWEAAERELTAAAQCAPRSAEVLETLALVYRMEQRLEEALATYEKLNALRPSPQVEEAIREVTHNIEAQAINRAADEEDDRIRRERDEADRRAKAMQDKIDRYVRAVSD